MGCSNCPKRTCVTRFGNGWASGCDPSLVDVASQVSLCSSRIPRDTEAWNRCPKLLSSSYNFIALCLVFGALFHRNISDWTHPLSFTYPANTLPIRPLNTTNHALDVRGHIQVPSIGVRPVRIPKPRGCEPNSNDEEVGISRVPWRRNGELLLVS